VPDGFCVTTEAHSRGEVSQAEVLAAYERLGGGPVAVRSSATAEDLPDASFAGQHDTFLAVEGADELLAAIRACWGSLDTQRASAYREAAGVAHDTVRMAVVVQRMVDAEVAGVLFTANPLTGSRSESVVDAVAGVGTALVDGTVGADHYVLDGTDPGERGCLTPARLRSCARPVNGSSAGSAHRRTSSGRTTATGRYGCSSRGLSPRCSRRLPRARSRGRGSTSNSATSRACTSR
jgi:rifampicin phosphotransferase